MGRPKKEKPNHGDLYEIKVTIGKAFDGTLIRKSFYSPISKEDAKTQANAYKIEQEVAERTNNIFVSKDVTFSQWSDRWLKSYKKDKVDENTYRMTYQNAVINHLDPYFGNKDLKIIKPVDVEDFFAKNKALSKSILSKLHMCLNGIFETAIDNDLCYKNPAKRATYLSTQDKHVKKVYTDEQIEKIIEICIIQMPEVAILLETGLRRGEFLGIMWSDFDEKNRTISVKRSIADIPGGIKTNPPKWGSYREIPLTDRSFRILKSITRDGLYIFPKADGKPQGPNQWSKKLKRYMEKVISPQDIPVLSAHELRHTYGTALRRRGVDIYTIQKIMGHKDINMTSEIYVHNEVDILRKSLGFSK